MGRAVFQIRSACFSRRSRCSQSTSRYAPDFPLALEHWTRGRVSLLTLAGLAAVVIGLVFLPDHRAARPTASTFPPMSRTACSSKGISSERAGERGRLHEQADLLREGPLADVMMFLNGDGEEPRLVGGTVRDLALESRRAISTLRRRRPSKRRWRARPPPPLHVCRPVSRTAR